MKRRIGVLGFLFCFAAGCTVPSGVSKTSPGEQQTSDSVSAAKKKVIQPPDGPGGSGSKVVPPFDGTSHLPSSICGTGSHFSFVGISPEPKVDLVAGAPLTIQAHVEYSLPPNGDDAIGLQVWSADVSAMDPLYETPFADYTPISSGAAGGCGSTDLTLEVPGLDAGTYTVSIVSANLGNGIGSVIFYRVGDVPYIRITGVSPPLNQLLLPDGLTGSVSISLEWDMKGHEVYPDFQYYAFDPYHYSGYSWDIFDFPDLSTSPVGSGTFTYNFNLDSRACHQEIWFLFEFYDMTEGTSSDNAAAHWFIQPVPFTLSGDSFYAQPGAGPQTGTLYAENCGDQDQTLQIASDSSWLTLASNSMDLPGSSSAWMDYSVDATGLVPYTELRGTLTATSDQSGETVSAAVDLWVDDYYVPCAPQIQLYDYNGPLAAEPGAPAATYELYIENCSAVPQTVSASSNVSWLTVSASPIVINVNDYAFLEYSIDATGLTPANVEVGTITVSSQDTGASADSNVELTVSDYYVPPPHYSAAATTYSWNAAADAGNGSEALGINTDDEAFLLTLPFPIVFYSRTYSQIGICSNGGILFGATSTYCSTYTLLPDMNLNPVLALNWDDLYVGASGSVRYATTGTAPNRKLVISFNAVGLYPDGASPSTFQAVFTEGSEPILVQYGTLNYQNVGGANFGDGYEYSSWTPAGGTALLVAP